MNLMVKENCFTDYGRYKNTASCLLPMSEDTGFCYFELDVGTYDVMDFPDESYEMVDTSEYRSGKRVATEFLSPCLGIIGLSNGEDQVYGAHISSPTSGKVDTFLNRYDADCIVVSGINYSQDQFDGHVDNTTKSSGVLEMSPKEVSETLGSEFSSIEELTAVEDVLIKRGSVENALEKNDIEYIAEWAEEPVDFSLIEASAPDGQVAVRHFDI